MEKEMAALKEEITLKTEESANREKKIKRLTKKLEVFMNNAAEDKSLWEHDDAKATSPMPSFSNEEEFPVDDFAQPQYQQPLSDVGGVDFQRLPSELSQQESPELEFQNNVSDMT